MRAFRLVHDESAFGCVREFSVTQDYLILTEVSPRAHPRAYLEARYDLRKCDLGWDDSPPSWAMPAMWKHWDLVVTQ